MSLKTICCSALTPARSLVLPRNPRTSQSISTTSVTRDAVPQSTPNAPGFGDAPPKGGQKRPGGSYTRVLAAFGVGMPLGWAVHTLYENNRGIHTAHRGEFVKYTLVDKEMISPTSSVFRMYPASGSVLDFSDPGLTRAVASVQFKQPQLQIARWYTLLPRIEDQEEHELRFLIRKEQNGEVSGYLHRLPVGSDIELRGPEAEYVLPEKVDSVLFLAGGTGIAPAMQVAQSLAGEADVAILWANRRREDCIGARSETQTEPTSIWNPTSWIRSRKEQPAAERQDRDSPNAQGIMVSQVEELASQPREKGPVVTVDYFVDEEGTFIRPERVTELVHRLSRSKAETSGVPGAKILIVSGPEGFVNYWAGPKRWLNGREVQGPVSGILAGMNLDGWEVVKL